MPPQPSADRALVLAVDLGTSALKAGLCAVDGSLHGSATVALGAVQSLSPGWAESDATEWVSALRSACRELAGSGRGAAVRAVVVSGHGPSLVAVDRAGRPLRPSLLWLDRRAVAEAAEIASLWGRPMEPWYFLPKALWLARHEPAVYREAAYLLSCPELLDYYLTGTAATVLHTEAFRHYYWREDIVSRLGMDPAKLAPFAAPGEGLGALRGASASELGLPPGIPVIAGGPDYLMSLLGTATVAPGRVCDRAGSSEGVNLCAASEVRTARLLCHPHVVVPLWNVAGTIRASGLAVEWARGVLGRSGESYESTWRDIAAMPPGSDRLLFVPFTGGGGRGAFVGLRIRHGAGHMVRAVVESVAFALRAILADMRSCAPLQGSVTVTGRQSRFDPWNQIKADVTGLEIRVPRVRDAEIVGGAVVAFTALGEYGALAEASERMVSIERVFSPDPGVADLYGELSAHHRELRRLL